HLYSAILKKPGLPSPVMRISMQPIVIGTAPDQSRAASIPIPIKELISNEALQKQCQEQLDKASKKGKTGKELQRRQKEPIQRVMSEIPKPEPIKEKEPILRAGPAIGSTYQKITTTNASKIRVTVPLSEDEERKIRYIDSMSNLQLSPDAIRLDSDDEPEIVGEVKAKDAAKSEKVAETGNEESEGVAEVSIANKEEEIAMDTEITPLGSAPEITNPTAATPMEISMTSEPQSSPTILDQGSVRSLIPSILKRSLHLYYPLDSL
ncbi:MAG: hypothetical protein GY853_02095, partial [PVC group bacterium]|nr:hypothetical protein [PVC group bacterium]